MEENKFYVMLEKEWFYIDESKSLVKEQTLLQEYNSDALMVYSLLLRNLTTRNTFSLNLDSIYSSLGIVKKDNARMIAKIRGAITKLNDNLFTVYFDSNCNSKVEDISKLENNTTYYCFKIGEVLTDKFIMAYDKELDKLIGYSIGKKNSISDLIAHYLFICNGFNRSEENDGYLCYFGSLDSIEKKTGIEQSILISHNKIFTELDLLLIGNAGGSISDKQYKNTSNIYARVENQIEFDKFMEIKKVSVGKRFDSKIEKQQQDKQRKLKQLINNYVKQPNIKGLPCCLLTVDEFMELQSLEFNYFNFVLSRGKEVSNTKFITIEEDGTLKNQYGTETAKEKIDREYNSKEDIPEFVENLREWEQEALDRENGYTNSITKSGRLTPLEEIKGCGSGFDFMNGDGMYDYERVMR